VINGDILMIYNVDYFRDGGRYTCTASNTHGSDSVNAHLNLDCKYFFVLLDKLRIKFSRRIFHLNTT